MRRGIEMLRDEHTAFGVPEKSTFGLLNHPNVAVLSLPNGRKLAHGVWTLCLNPA